MGETADSRPERILQRRKPKWPWIILVMVILLVCTSYFLFRPKPTRLTTASVKLATLHNTVFESGTVNPVNQQFVYASQLASPVTSFPTGVGGKIQKGEVLVHLQQSGQVGGLASTPLPTARFNGTVIEENADGIASDGTQVPVLELVSPMKQVVSEVSEVDAIHIMPGMSVSMTTDAYPGQTFHGTVARVANYANLSASGTSQVEVDITPTGTDPIPLGYQVNINIQTATHRQVPVVPYSALTQVGENYSVFVVRNGHAYAVPVTLGITSSNTVEVVKGVTAGTVILVNPPTTLVSGQAVVTTS